MKKLVAFGLIFGLLLSSALGAGTGGRPLDAPTGAEGRTVAAAAGGGFSDVKAGSWYGQGVAVCARAGLMEGTGDGRFEPQRPLSQPECLTLALRLYDLEHGGDGVLPPAPADWSLGAFTLETADGQTLTACVSDPEAVSFQPTGLVFSVEKNQAAWAEGLDGTTAVLRYRGGAWSAPLQYRNWNAAPELIFPVEPGISFYEDYDGLSRRRGQVPCPEAWYRDAWYYLEANGLSGQFYFSFEEKAPASRGQFALALAASGAELEDINRIGPLPDVEDDRVLSLYRAGVLTGVDGYGRFAGASALTRAEAAVMLARVLEPGLRLSFSPAVLAPERAYTLTYLLDGWPDCGVTYPVCVLANGEPGPDGILTLDGRLLPWPGTVPSFGLYRDGAYCHFGVWDYDVTPWRTKDSLMDRNGDFVVPLGTYDQLHATADGHFVACRDGDSRTVPWVLLDGSGAEVGTFPPLNRMPGEPGDASWWSFNEGLCPWKDPESGLWGYVDARGEWALSPAWAQAGDFRDGAAVVRRPGGLCGAIDHAGTEVVPCAYGSLEYGGNGRFFCWDQDTRVYLALRPFGEAEEIFFDPDAGLRGQNGYFPCAWGVSPTGERLYCYLDENLVPVTPAAFTFAGDIGPDGSGFAGKDGKIYRIQFQ